MHPETERELHLQIVKCIQSGRGFVCDFREHIPEIEETVPTSIFAVFEVLENRSIPSLDDFEHLKTLRELLVLALNSECEGLGDAFETDDTEDLMLPSGRSYRLLRLAKRWEAMIGSFEHAFDLLAAVKAIREIQQPH